MPYADPEKEREFRRRQSARLRAANLGATRTYQREWRKQWRAKHREEDLTYQRQYRKAHPESTREWNASKYARTKADPVKHRRLREMKAAYKKANPPVELTPEKKREYNQRAYYKHQAKILAQKKSIYVPRNTRRKGPDIEGLRLWRREYQAKRKGAAGSCTPDQWRARIAYYGNCCAYCHLALTLNTVSVDHVKPTVAGGSNWPANLVPACLACNRKKNRHRWIPRPVWQRDSAPRLVTKES